MGGRTFLGIVHLVRSRMSVSSFANGKTWIGYSCNLIFYYREEKIFRLNLFPEFLGQIPKQSDGHF